MTNIHEGPSRTPERSVAIILGGMKMQLEGSPGFEKCGSIWEFLAQEDCVESLSYKKQMALRGFIRELDARGWFVSEVVQDNAELKRRIGQAMKHLAVSKIPKGIAVE